MNGLVILFVTVCLNGGDSQCEEFGVESWEGNSAMELCVEHMQREVQVSEIAGTLQTWRCVDMASEQGEMI